MRAKINKTNVESLEKGQMIFDTELRGFVARRLGSGQISYGLKYTDAGTGRQRWFALGLHNNAFPAEKARRAAESRRGQVADGKDPQAEREAERRKRSSVITVNDLLDSHVVHYIEANKLRSTNEIKRIFDKYVRPELGRLLISELRRGHVVALLDKVAVNNGAVTSDRVLAHLRKALNWHATRDERFSVPIVRGMARTKPRELARKRVLSDDEIRAMWIALDRSDDVHKEKGAEPELFACLVRTLFLSAQRREEVAGMAISELSEGIWTIPAARHKTGKDGEPKLLPLSGAAWTQIEKARELTRGNLIFSTTGNSPFSGFARAKRRLDFNMLTELRRAMGLRGERAKIEQLNEVAVLLNAAHEGDRAASQKLKAVWWTLHDLRRTAKTLMARAGVRPDISERVLGHAIPGVEGVYDRHSYRDEKLDALERLAALVLRIVKNAENVIELKRAYQIPSLRGDAVPDDVLSGVSQ